jgi:hypothetical protein
MAQLATRAYMRVDMKILDCRLESGRLQLLAHELPMPPTTVAPLVGVVTDVLLESRASVGSALLSRNGSAAGWLGMHAVSC